MRVLAGIGRFTYVTLRTGVMALIWAGILACSFAIGFLYAIVKEMPLLESLSVPKPAVSSELFAGDGRSSLGMVHEGENRILVTSEQVPKNLKNAFIAIEDKSFYDHSGIDPRGMARALVTNVQEGDVLGGQGASTITQQLVRTLYLTRQKKLFRKLQEIIIALRIEKKYSKEEILNFYMNEIFLGSRSYGVEAASQTYFKKSIKDLTLAECAMIAGLPQRPSRYSPFVSMKAATGRRNVVLTKMREQGYITKEQETAAKAEPITLVRALNEDESGYKGLLHPWFAKAALDEAATLLGPEGGRQVYFGGLRIYTTMDSKLQDIAEKEVAEHLKKFTKAKIEQGALVAMDPKTGRVLAMVGGKDFHDNEFNRATQAKRQPGSSFKPFVYLAALRDGYSPLSLVNDSPRTFLDDIGREYKPHNYDNSFKGIMTAKRALELSRNVPSVITTNIVGPKAVAEVANLAGIRAKLPEYLSLGLGAGEVTLLDLTSAYSTFAARGVYRKPYLVETITDSRGRVLFQRRNEGRRVFDANLVDMLNYMLQGVMVNGTGAKSRLDRPSAGKTGTTSDYVDAWFLGYTPNLVCGTWVGRDDNTPMVRGVTGGNYPAKIWKDFMMEALAGKPEQEFPEPDFPRFTQALDDRSSQHELQTAQEEAVEEDTGGVPAVDPEAGDGTPVDRDGDGRPDPPPIFF